MPRLLLLASLLFIPGAGLATDAFGGLADTLGTATGFFRVDRDQDGRWWFVTPSGHRFWSAGLDVIRPDWEAEPTFAKQFGGNAYTWAALTLPKIQNMGFNTLGSNHHDRKRRWQPILRQAEPRLPYVLDFAPFPFHDPRKPGVPHVPFMDVFSETFERRYKRAAKEIPADIISDPYLLGYLFNNELNWGLFGSFSGLWQDHVGLPPHAPGKIAYVELLKSRYDNDINRFRAVYGDAQALLSEKRMLSTQGEGPIPPDVAKRVRAAYVGPRAPRFETWDDVGAFTDTQLLQTAVKISSAVRQDMEAFLGIISDRYHGVASRALRSVDSNHLLLGCKFIGGKWYSLSDPVLLNAAKHIDVVSQNVYFKPGTASGRHQLDFVDRAARITKRPQLLTEWGGFHAQDTRKCRCYIPVANQAERARLFSRGWRQLAGSPYVVGAFYYSFADHDHKNWGVFDTSLVPYPDMAAAMKKTAPLLGGIHTRTPGP